MSPLKPFCTAIIAVAIVGNCFAVPKARNALVIGDYMYFTDTRQNRTRAEAAEFCLNDGGELAKIWNNNLYNQIRLATRQGAYWVDGIDRRDEFRFDFNRSCPHKCEHVDWSRMPTINLDIPQVSCLSLVKGSRATNSKLAAVNCHEQQFVLCQYSMNGCPAGGNATTRAGGCSPPTTTPSTMNIIPV